GTAIRLDPDWALQNPDDYIESLKQVIPEALKQSGIRADDVIGIGIDFTSATIIPTMPDGTPLCALDKWKTHPHAWVKLWKHHAAQPEADRINELARARNERWLSDYGGKISSEFLHCKTLQILDEAPEIFAAADKLLEGGDWLVWQLTGRLSRNACAAGHRALWQKTRGYPNNDFLRALDPRLVGLNETKFAGQVVLQGSRVGGLTERAARWIGLRPGTPVAAAMVDAHAAFPGAGITEPGRMVMILGTSTVQMLVDSSSNPVSGISGVIADGIIPGLFAYEAGQAGVGDIFEWFVEHAVPASCSDQAQARGISVFQLLEEQAAQQKPGEHGVLALDWWNGNRSVLADANVSGMLLGATLSTRAPDIYRALIEATAFGTQIIIETFETNGVPVEAIVACGGLAERNTLLMQIYADVTGRAIHQAASSQTSAMGAAILAAVASGVYDSIADATKQMTQPPKSVYQPIPAHHAIYRRLYAEYRRLHDYFGRAENRVMKNLREIQRQARQE
ncbi:MAG: ribulokinase, partial [Anaerolineales bacterium]|nr:ribulokinase [Anaerolineales bacterium]